MGNSTYGLKYFQALYPDAQHQHYGSIRVLYRASTYRISPKPRRGFL